MTPEDYESVERAGRLLHERGWRMDINEMTDAWRLFVAEIETGPHPHLSRVRSQRFVPGSRPLALGRSATGATATATPSGSDHFNAW